MTDVLIGTTNPAKVDKYRRILEGEDYNFLTPHDLGITDEPNETGADQVENAAIKAKFYGRYCDKVICMDSGLYYLDIPKDDPRQPKLHVRTPQGVRLDDDEMLEYYIALVKSMGGRARACWMDGTAVYSGGRIYTLAEPEDAVIEKIFYMIDTPSEARHIGWPLDSISLYADTGRYFTDDEPRHIKQSTEDETGAAEKYRRQLREFLICSFK